MSCDELPDELRIVWNEAGSASSMLSADQLREHARKLEARRRKDYLILILASLSAVAGHVFFVFYFRSLLVRIGSTLCILTFLYLMAAAMARRTRGVPDPAEANGVGFYPGELERRRDWHCWVRSRLMMLACPLILVDLGLSREMAWLSPFLPPIMWSWGVFLLVALGIWGPAKHRKLAHKYQDRIDALNARDRR